MSFPAKRENRSEAQYFVAAALIKSGEVYKRPKSAKTPTAAIEKWDNKARVAKQNTALAFLWKIAANNSTIVNGSGKPRIKNCRYWKDNPNSKIKMSVL